MKLRKYIVISFLFHLLFFSAIVIVLPKVEKKTLSPVFNVDIVGAVEGNGIAPKTILKETRPAAILGEETRLGRQKLNDEDKLPAQANSPNDSGSDFAKDSQDKKSLLTPKAFLFDKETIEKYSQNETAKEGQGSKGLTFDMPELHHRGYMRMLKDKIEGIWKYPEAASRQGISGDLYIRFVIKRDGRLGDVELLRTSGYKVLDDAAMKAVKEGAPYWPLPDDWEENELSIPGHFIYLPGEFYVM